MSTAEQRAWEREQKRRLEQAGEDEAGRLNQDLQNRVGRLEQLLAWSLAHPVTVDFAAMKVPLPRSNQALSPARSRCRILRRSSPSP